MCVCLYSLTDAGHVADESVAVEFHEPIVEQICVDVQLCASSERRRRKFYRNGEISFFTLVHRRRSADRGRVDASIDGQKARLSNKLVV